MSVKNKPKISVMIVTYNQEDLIQETIDSVLEQGYENLEIVVADDASTDATPKIIKEYYDKYPDIIVPVLNEKNLGITGNSNAAFFACSGEFIALLGGDDLFLSNKLSKQIEVFTDEDVVLSYHPVDVFLHQTGESLFISNQSKNEQLNDVYEIISKGGIPGASSIMVRKSACPEHGFDPDLKVVSDWIFSIEVAYRGKVVEVSEVLGKYRKHGKGASERTFELLDESLLTLDKIQQKYPSDTRLKEACSLGRYRYLCGELYRQIDRSNYGRALYLTKKMSFDIPLEKRKQWILISAFTNNKILFRIASYLLPKVKNILKRIL